MTDEALGVAEAGLGRVAVIGAGSMGSGIAAQFANAGVAVDLLDLPSEGGRNARAEAGIARQIEVGGFMGRAAPGRVRAGNTEDDLGRLAEADWIVEVVVENLAAKRDLFERIDAVRRPGTIVSSNTSTIRRADLVAGLGGAFDRDFVITHFFNPPRMMQPVELVSGSATDPAIVARTRVGAEVVLGKTVIPCRDTPGFIANRIGCTWMAMAVTEAIRLGLTVEEADAVHGALGVPRTGVFGLFDLIGIDLVPHVWRSLMDALPDSDAIRHFDLPATPLIRTMIAEGRHGRKTGAGFYRKAADGRREALDLATGSYRPVRPVDPRDLPGGGRDLVALIDAGGPLAAYAWRVFSLVVAYAAEHAPEIAEDCAAVDSAVALGYAWNAGPFALADRFGAARLRDRLAAERSAVPALLDRAVEAGGFFDADGAPLAFAGGRARHPVAGSHLGVATLRARGPRLHGNAAASLWDMGDGVACLEIHTKMNALGPAVFDMLETTLGDGRVRALVIGNDDPRAFSAGADLGFFLGRIEAQAYDEIERYLARGQELMLALRYAPVPVVAAVRGFALGGGCELALHADRIVAHAEAAIGLPEAKVGLLPGWGGCTRLLHNTQSGGADPAEATRRTFATILAAGISGSAAEARETGFLSPRDGVVMHRAHVMGAARDAVLALAEGYRAPERPRLTLAGPAVGAALVEAVAARPDATATDVDLARRLAVLLAGEAAGSCDEVEMMAAERRAVLALARLEAVRARMAHMLATGKPLRN